MLIHAVGLSLLAILIAGCRAGPLDATPSTLRSSTATVAPPQSTSTLTTALPTPTSSPAQSVADVISVDVAGEAQAYRFAVEVRSPDTGCDRYADWWEVLTEDGHLVYRRILAHSHVNEQPFVRSGGPVEITPTTVVLVRAHMHPTGYGGTVLRGSVQEGFVEADIGAAFAAEVEDSAPQPDGCAF